jgi:hypothetical protein
MSLCKPMSIGHVPGKTHWLALKCITIMPLLARALDVIEHSSHDNGLTPHECDDPDDVYDEVIHNCTQQRTLRVRLCSWPTCWERHG